MLLIQQGGDSGRQKMLVPRAQDADDEDSGSGSDSESDDDEDDMEALQAELERIKYALLSGHSVDGGSCSCFAFRLPFCTPCRLHQT